MKNKGFAFINILGLAIGLTASLLILLWVPDELNDEKHNPNAERIYRIEEDKYYPGGSYHVTITAQPSGYAWKEKNTETAMIPVLIARVVVLPAGWTMEGTILRQFASRIEMSNGIFIIIAPGILIIALATVTFQAVKASLINPAEVLKI